VLLEGWARLKHRQRTATRRTKPPCGPAARAPGQCACHARRRSARREMTCSLRSGSSRELWLLPVPTGWSPQPPVKGTTPPVSGRRFSMG